MHTTRALLQACIALSGILACTAALAVGKFMYLDGAVTVRDAGGVSRTAARGERVALQDTIATGEGRAQLRFDDGGWVSLQPRTVFEVKEYEWRQDGKIVISLLKGAARAVTGLLSQSRQYNFVTPVATIGIRGTSFQVTYCVQSCDVPDGLYVTGGDGTIFVRNGFGEIDLSRGRTAYVATAQTPPRESSVKPIAEVQEQMTPQQIAATGSTTVGELRPGNFIYFQGESGYAGPFTTTFPTSAGFAMAASGSASAQGSATVDGIFKSESGSVSGADVAAGAGTLAAGEILALVLDGAGRPVSATVTDAHGRVSGTALTAPEMSGNDGILYWGRWTNTTFQADAQEGGNNATGSANLPAGSYLHYMFGQPAGSVPMAGSATYTFVGGSGSTSAAGTAGAGVTSGNLSVNFATNSLSTSLSISHGGTYSASGTGFLEPGARANFSGPSGTATGPTGTHAFKFDGFFAGAGAPTAPARAGMAWHIQSPDAIVGTAGFRCATGC